MNSKKSSLTLNNKIGSLQALRAIAFLGIFLGHAEFFVNWATFGVSVFFILSGFLLMYKYKTKEFHTSIKENLSFSLKKIKKLYPLHIITMLCMVILTVIIIIYNGNKIKSYLVLLFEIGLNSTLLQTWFPYSNINVSLNGVSWYLSATMFLYFMFPYISKVINKYRLKVLCIICLSILALQIFLCLPAIVILGPTSHIYTWFMYFFPVFRLGEFFIGGCLAKFYNKSKNNLIKNEPLKVVIYTIIEILAIIATALMIIMKIKDYDNIFLQAINNQTTLHIPFAVMWIYLFIEKKGLITNILSNKILINLGNISSYTFLIHYVVTQYVITFFDFFNINLNPIQQTILVLSELALTIILSLIYIKIKTRINLFFYNPVIRLKNLFAKKNHT